MKVDAEIKSTVRERYGAIATAPTGACGCCGEAGANLVGDMYEGVAGHVAEADLGLGCGLPTRHAGIREGDTVLDLGAGAGNDAFVAWEIVGERGRVIGVDMTAAMGWASSKPCRSQMPRSTSRSVTACSIWCLTRLARSPGSFACCARVRISASRTSWRAPLCPRRFAPRPSSTLVCVAGAMEQEQYLELIRAVGFSEVQIAESRTLEVPDSLLAQHLDGEEIAAFRAAGTRLLSVTALGTRPFTACCGESCCR